MSDQTYILQRAASLERIAHKLQDERPIPLAVLMLGYKDCNNRPTQRQHVQTELIKFFGGHRQVEVHDCTYIVDIERLYRLEPRNKVHIFDLKSDLGRDPTTRAAAISAIRNLGAKTIIGVHCTEPWPITAGFYQGRPPRAEEFDYLITVPYEDTTPE